MGGVLILMLLTVIPVKIGAELFGAENKGLQYCFLVVVIGTILSLTSFALIGGLIGLIVAYVVVSFVYSKVFQLSFYGGLAFTLAVFIIQIGVTQGLTDLGVYMLT